MTKELTDGRASWPEHGPIVVLGRGHSGTRFLAEAFERQGVFIGGNLNSVFDSLTWESLIEQVVLGIYPRYDLLRDGDVWHQKVEATARRFLAEGFAGGPWGWKISETAFILPLVARVFPGLRAIHLIRDGRDVMLSRLKRVERLRINPFNRKIILGDEHATSWFGRRLNRLTLFRYRNEFEMYSWVQSVTASRRYGQALGPGRYIEIRYEDMCREPVKTVGAAFEFASLAMTPDVRTFLEKSARVDRISKWESVPAHRIAGAVSVGKLLLQELGYMPVPADADNDPARHAAECREAAVPACRMDHEHKPRPQTRDSRWTRLLTPWT